MKMWIAVDLISSEQKNPSLKSSGSQEGMAIMKGHQYFSCINSYAS